MDQPNSCPGCGGRPTRTGYAHRYPCHRKPTPLPEPRRLVPLAERLATAELIVRQLLAHAHELGLNAPAPTAWPDDGLDTDIVPEQRVIGMQLRIARRALRRLDPHHPLLEVVSALLTRPIFHAPVTSDAEPKGVRPPTAISLALARLAALTPTGVSLTEPQADDSESIGRQRRLVQVWLDQLEGQVED